MNKQDIIKNLLPQRTYEPKIGEAFAPTNIALIKYWGKRNDELHLPVTNSFSITLPRKGTRTILDISTTNQDQITINNQSLGEGKAYQKIVDYLNLFRPYPTFRFSLKSYSNIPMAAGLASSASGFSALTLALNEMFSWNLDRAQLSILARLGSGSACRSLWNGFVEWQVGEREDGLDSYGIPYSEKWPELRIGLLIISENEKHIGSREAMQSTVQTSKLYETWPQQVNEDLSAIKSALKEKAFNRFASIAENNARAMHATMHDATPSIVYNLPETLALQQKIWDLREQGLDVYYTQDAGPNLKLLFLERDIEAIKEHFPNCEIVAPFPNNK